MNIQQIKREVATKQNFMTKDFSLDIRQDLDEKDQPTDWVSYWENETRTRISMHKDVFAKLQADRNMEGLAYKFEVVPATPERAAYTRVIVITPANILATF